MIRILLACLLVGTCSAQMLINPFWWTASPPPSYLIEESFEGTGYEVAGWTENAGNPDEDSTTQAAEGTQSIYKSASVYTSTYNTFTACDPTCYARFAFRFSTFATGSTIVELWNGVTRLLRVQLAVVSSVNRMRLYDGTRTGDGSTTALSADTWYLCWVQYTAGTGSDGLYKLYINTTDERPETAEITISNGVQTLDANEIDLVWEVGGFVGWYDIIRVDDEDF